MGDKHTKTIVFESRIKVNILLKLCNQNKTAVNTHILSKTKVLNYFRSNVKLKSIQCHFCE